MKNALTILEVFQSTLPRVGRDIVQFPGKVSIHISIRPPREGRDTGGDVLHVDVAISIHPPRVGRDLNRPSVG